MLQGVIRGIFSWIAVAILSGVCLVFGFSPDEWISALIYSPPPWVYSIWVRVGAVVFGGLLGWWTYKLFQTWKLNRSEVDESLAYEEELKPVPDMSIRDAFKHILLYSKLAIGQDTDNEHYYDYPHREIIDKARIGRLNVWARKKQRYSGGFPEVLEPVSEEKWSNMAIDLPSMVYDEYETGIIRDETNWRDPIEFYDVQLNKAQVLELWPKAKKGDLKNDPLHEKRLAFFREEKSGVS